MRRMPEAQRTLAAAIAAMVVVLASPGPSASWANGLFVPAPRGAGETLGSPPGSATAANCDTVMTVQGDRLSGTVIGMEAGGRLRLSGPQFDGEVQVLVSAIDRLTLVGKDEEPGGDEVVLTNGDRILGEIAALTKDAVVLQTHAAGSVRIARRVVRSLAMAKGKTVLLDSNFAGGQLRPWTPRGGTWSVTDGCLMSSHSSSSYYLHAKLEQKEAVTFVAKVQATGSSSLRCTLVLFAGSSDNVYGRSSVFVLFQSSQFYLNYAQGGGTHTIVNRSLGRSVRQGILRLAYDPETGKAKLWLDSNELAECTVPNKPTSGRFVIFNSYPAKIDYLRVLRGIVPPPGSEAAGEEQTDVVRFANKDRVSVTSVAVADGEVKVTTSYGELRCPVENVGTIVFRKEGREEPRRRKGDVWVETSGGRLTLQFQRLTDEHLIGAAEHLGEVRLRRSAIKAIRFNIHEGADRLGEVRVRSNAIRVLRVNEGILRGRSP